MSKNKKYTHRYIARVVLEAQTPLFVGSGETSLITDALVQKDLHGFPIIQGTSLTGVLRHSLEDDKKQENGKWNSFFGFQKKLTEKEIKEGKINGSGSQVKISSAYLVLENGKIAEGLQLDENQKEFKKYFEDLPSRQHARITHKGVAKEHGLFDNEVVYKGCRFLFEIELKGDEEDKNLWSEFLNQLKNPLFRIGQGTRNGYGNLSVHSCKTKVFDLNNKADFKDYLDFDNSLNSKKDCLKDFEIENNKELNHYQLQLKPENFFMFGAGYGDDEVDNIPITEDVISYDDKNSIQKPEKQTLIPASSIKGALRHRTAFHYNGISEIYTDKLNKESFKILHKFYTEINNDAIFELFGAEEGVENRDKNKEFNLFSKREGQRGKIIMNDYLSSKIISDKKIFNHVAIDRFTSGAMDGALFSEKVSYFKEKNEEITLNVFVENSENLSKNVIEAFEETLKDVCKGLLPLGGMTTKGHGIFTGKFFINNNEKPKFDYENK